MATNPILHPQARQHAHGEFSHEELALANRNCGTLLETLQHDITPTGAHYLLNHFDVPAVDNAQNWSLTLDGHFTEPVTVSLAELHAMPVTTKTVTLECAGNGRRHVSPRWPSQPWGVEAVGTAQWTGTPLRNLLLHAGIRDTCREIVFHGIDRGVDGGQVHNFARSLTPEDALHEEILLAWKMNGIDLPPQHGYPLRLVVPGWYGMASVKWLSHIEAIDYCFDGYQQTKTYVYRQSPDDSGTPVTHMRVKSLLVPPGIPDWSSRKRLVEPGLVTLQGRAWSGAGVPITRVEVGLDGTWQDATVDQCDNPYHWCNWHFDWQASIGQHLLSCRATDANGHTQPLQAPWDTAGFGNNSVHAVEVWCA
ncbi:sulfite oxidase [Chromatiales bacterium (ex Bugula neritina AB1)]|nr:sulfite oxidase [Chromatiales bacterium (ex Bugula neritina AB1)]